MAVDNVCIGLMIFLALILLVAFICAMCMSSESSISSTTPGTDNFTQVEKTMVPTVKDPGLFIRGPRRMTNPWNLKPMGVKPPQPSFRSEQNIVFPKKVALQDKGPIISNETPRLPPYTVQYLVNGYGGANTRLGTNLGL